MLLTEKFSILVYNPCHMTDKQNSSELNTTDKASIILLWMSVFEGIIALVALLTLPSETGKFFGLSLARLAILLTILLPCTVCLIFASSQSGRKSYAIRLSLIEREPLLSAAVFILLAILCSIVPTLLQDLYTGTNIYAYSAYSQRLLPLTSYAAILLFQIAIYVVISNRVSLKKTRISDKHFLKTWGLAFGGVLILVMLIAITRFGLNHDRIGWGKPTVPLMEWQIWLGILLLIIFRLSKETSAFQKAVKWIGVHPIFSRWLVSISIWVLAFGLWASLPVPPGFFATPPRAPNFEIYPFSDAAFYDFHAQSMLIGLGFRGDSIPPRPLYILFLAFAHVIMGQDYTRVILLQTAILAFLPVTVFWIGKRLSNSQIGLVAAVFIIFREWTSIICTPFTSDVSNSKLLFADMPAALVVSLVLLSSISWLQNPRRLKWALLTGGLLGISLLVRTQIIILLPALLVFFWLISIQRKISFKPVLLSSLICLMGFALAVAPWLSRSYRITGQFVFDHPESQTRVMVQRYYPDVEMTDFDRQSGETTGEYNQRLSSAIRQKIQSNPGDLVNFMAAHWLNNEIGNLLIFPVRFSITSLQELAWPEHAYWEDWQGNATPFQLGLILINLAVLAAGVVYLTMRNSWIGLLPLVFNFAYHFSNSAARNSGWRYLLPADWIFMLYFPAGLFALINLGRLAIVTPNITVDVNRKPPPVLGLTSLAAGILCIGLLPLAAESAFPKIYPKASANSTGQAITASVTSLPTETQAGIKDLLKDPNVIIMDGRMLYPRFYGEKEGEEKTGKTGYTPLPYARYVFLVAGDPEGTVIFPQENGELPLRNAGDVILAGCMDGLAVKANVVLLPSTGEVYTAGPSIPWTCSPQP
jgi:hypothetical protein